MKFYIHTTSGDSFPKWMHGDIHEVRDIDAPHYLRHAIRFYTLEGLMKFIKKTQRVVIHQQYMEGDLMPSIEIYDDYRE